MSSASAANSGGSGDSGDSVTNTVTTVSADTATDTSTAPLFYAPVELQDKARSLKLIELKQDQPSGEVQVADAGSTLLQNLPSDTPLNLVFVFGLARTGKSFLLNCLSGVRGLFKVANTSTPCTKGVDISSYTTPLASLRAAVGHADGGESERPGGENENKREKGEQGGAGEPIVGFVDVEGQGAEDGTYDTMLALPLLLTSRVVLFNHKGAPTVNDMLSRLGVLARAADYIELPPEPAEAKAGTLPNLPYPTPPYPT
jgi:hypothetical protein